MIAKQRFPDGAKVRVPNNGRMVAGVVVRYDAGGGNPFYVVDVGGFASLKVPEYLVDPEQKESMGMERLSALLEAGFGLDMPPSQSGAKAAGSAATITINGNEQYVKAYDDGIHLAFSGDGVKWGVPVHIAQLTGHPNATGYVSAANIRAAGKALLAWLKNPVAKNLGVFGE